MQYKKGLLALIAVAVLVATMGVALKTRPGQADEAAYEVFLPIAQKPSIPTMILDPQPGRYPTHTVVHVTYINVEPGCSYGIAEPWPYDPVWTQVKDPYIPMGAPNIDGTIAMKIQVNEDIAFAQIKVTCYTDYGTYGDVMNAPYEFYHP